MLLVSQRDVVTHGIQPVRNRYILEAVGNRVNLVAKCGPESFTFGLLKGTVRRDLRGVKSGINR